MVRLGVVVLTLAGCGRLGFSPSSGDGGAGLTDDGGDDSLGDGQALDECTLASSHAVSSPLTNAGSPDLAWTGTELAVVWSDQRLAEYEVFLARLDPTGAKLGSDVNVSNTGGAHSWFPAVAFSGSMFGVTWSEENATNDILFRRLTDQGVLQANNVVIDGGNGEAWWPAIAWTGSQFSITWADDTTGQYEVTLAARDAAGVEVLAPLALTSTSQQSWSPAINWTGSEVAIAYSEAATVALSRNDPSGAPVVAPQVLVPSAPGSERPSITWNGNGWALAWHDARTGVDSIYFTRFDAAGGVLAPEHRLSTGASEFPVVRWTGDGYVVVWIEDRGQGPELASARLDANAVVTHGPSFLAPSRFGSWPTAAWTSSALAVAWTAPGSTEIRAGTVVCN